MGELIPSVLVTGYAMMPKQHYIHGTQHLVIITLEVDPLTGRILRADSNLSVELYRTFVSELLVGRSLHGSISDLISPIRERVLTVAAEVIQASIKDAVRNYQRLTRS